MFKTLRASLYTIGLTSGAATVAVLAFALWSFGSLGRSAADAQASSAVVASALPPPLYLIETRLVVSRIVEGSMPTAEAAAALQQLRRENEEEVALWSGQGADDVRRLVAGPVAHSSRGVFDAAATVLALAGNGDATGSRQALGLVQAAYDRHRAAIDDTVRAAKAHETAAIARFEATRTYGTWAMLAAAAALLAAGAWAYLRGLRSVLQPVHDCVALAHRVAADDLHQPPPSDRSDELGELQTALGKMTANLAASRERLLEAKAAAERAGQAKADFLANMSHEIRTPMNAVLGLTHIVLQTSLSVRQRDYLEKIQGSGRSLLRLINDILDFSKIEAGKLDLERLPFELDRLLDEVVAVLNPLILAKPVELVLRRDAAVPDVLLGDGLRLKQVLLNLAGNAVKFTRSGEVCIAAELVAAAPAAATIRFSVKDTGVGIPEPARRQLFTAFTQADGSTARMFGGTGLGLAISQRIVALMGATIEVDSTVGEGSTFAFTVTLDVADEGTELARSAAQRSTSARRLLKGGSALVVDDNFTARLTMVAMLRSFGMRVADAQSGTQALALARAAQARGESVDVALVDWKMPDLDGFEVMAALRGCAALAHASFVMVSAYDREVVEAAMTAPAPEGVLQKPVTPSTLLDTLAGVFHRAGVGGLGDALPAQPLVQLQGQVLVVEDNEINQIVAAEMLQAMGLQVKLADNAVQALDQLGSARFDAVLMDVQMPGMDGFAATRIIRGQPEFKGLTIIALTANSLPGEREKCLAAGMNDYLAKPIDPDLLAACLVRWLPAKAAAAGEPARA